MFSCFVIVVSSSLVTVEFCLVVSARVEFSSLVIVESCLFGKGLSCV